MERRKGEGRMYVACTHGMLSQDNTDEWIFKYVFEFRYMNGIRASVGECVKCRCQFPSSAKKYTYCDKNKCG